MMRQKACKEKPEALLWNWRSRTGPGIASSGNAAVRARYLAEAIILQAIEDLWNPVDRKDSLFFFQKDGFALCSEIAGFGHIKQLAILRMLAAAGAKSKACIWGRKLHVG